MIFYVPVSHRRHGSPSTRCRHDQHGCGHGQRPTAMSNVFAIATVTETIVQMLSDALDAAQVSGAHVTALPPDAEHGLPNPGVNVFLYQILPNPALRNADLPTRRADGTLLRK